MIKVKFGWFSFSCRDDFGSYCPALTKHNTDFMQWTKIQTMYRNDGTQIQTILIQFQPACCVTDVYNALNQLLQPRTGSRSFSFYRSASTASVDPYPTDCTVRNTQERGPAGPGLPQSVSHSVAGWRPTLTDSGVPSMLLHSSGCCLEIWSTNMSQIVVCKCFTVCSTFQDCWSVV